jgi:CrcB protein
LYLILRFVYIATGGAIGAVARYGMSGWIQNLTESSFPWGTLCVNTVGSLFIGLFWGLSELTPVSPTVRLFFSIGFIGAFTTFSTYSLETLNLLRDKEMMLSFVNIALNNILALVFVFGGYFLSRYILGVLK